MLWKNQVYTSFLHNNKAKYHHIKCLCKSIIECMVNNDNSFLANCDDRSELCKRPLIKALCRMDSTIRGEFCRRSCGVCDQEEGTTTEDCKNNWSGFWCAIYQFSCTSTRVRKNCRKTCDVCSWLYDITFSNFVL